MFNPEKLLGGLLRSGRRGRGLGSLVSGGAALGLVGVAMEAVEHYMNKSGAAGPAPPPGPPGKVAGPASVGGSPPPGPGQGQRPPAPPAPPAGGRVSNREDHAILLIQAMISAANADGTIDADERARILGKLQSVDLSHQEHEFIVHELLDPKPMKDLLEAVDSAALAEQVYAASVLAIEADTAAEKQYLRDLAQQLGLEAQVIAGIHQQLDVPVP